MGLIFYNIFLWVFRLAACLSSPFSPKARKWVSGRRNIFTRIEKTIAGNRSVIWVHCASLGEFEQGRPLIERLKTAYPDRKILLTFFSPSGYEVQKNYRGADWIEYMPMDGPLNAKRFLRLVNPGLVIFIKYEYWYYYLKKIRYRNIPLLLVSANFRENDSFFRWHGWLQRKMLTRFDHLFVQDELSRKLLSDIGFGEMTTVSGDTRFDRVVEIASAANSLEKIDVFLNGNPCIVAGSTWPEDERLLVNVAGSASLAEHKFIIAPHEINDRHISQLLEMFAPSATTYSNADPDARVLIIDNIGLLSKLYKYGDFCYVGGGLSGGGLHNVLEAAVYGKIIFIGTNYVKYREAVDLVSAGCIFPVDAATGMLAKIESFLRDPEKRNLLEKISSDYVRSQQGATTRILRFIQEKRLLTS